MELSLPVALSLIMMVGIACQWLAWRLEIPAIVLLAASGLVMGPGLGWINPTENFGPNYTELIHLFVAIILFEGGLNLRFRELKAAGQMVRRLTSLGLIAAWVIGAMVCHYIGGISWPVSLVLGAILVVTGPTVIMPMLRHAQLNRKSASYLKWEGIINDPLGVLLAVLVYQYLLYSGENAALGATLLSLTAAIVTAIVLGGVGGYGLGLLFKRNRVPEYLKAPIIVVSVIGINSLSHLVQHESGLLAVTLMGIVMGNMKLRSIDEMRRFKEYLTILLVTFLFIILTASIEREQLLQIDLKVAILVASFLFLVRPLAAGISTIGVNSRWQDRLLLAWIAPRGVVAAATSAAVAPRLVESGYPDAALMVPIVFALIFATVVIHGLTMKPLVRALALSSPGKNRVLVVGASPWSNELCHQLEQLDVEYLLVDTDWERLRPARHRGLSTWKGEILSEHGEESLEFDNVSSVLATTSNSAYNSLVCVTFAPDVGRQNVFELRSGEEPEGLEHQEQSHTSRGVSAFTPNVDFNTLWQYLAHGWEFRKTQISEDFDYEAALETLPSESILLAIIDSEHRLKWTSERKLDPQPGDVLLSFGPGEEKARSNSI